MDKVIDYEKWIKKEAMKPDIDFFVGMHQRDAYEKGMRHMLQQLSSQQAKAIAEKAINYMADLIDLVPFERTVKQAKDFWDGWEQAKARYLSQFDTNTKPIQ